MFVTAARRSWCLTIVLALAAVVILGVFPYLTAVNNPNENVRTYMTMAIVEDHTLRIDRMVQRHGWINDMAKAPDPVTKEDHVYSVKGPAISYFGVPAYWAFVKVSTLRGRPPPTVTAPLEERVAWLRSATFVCRFFAVQIPCFLFLVWFARFLRSVTNDEVFRATAVVAAGLGTNYLAYSQMFVSHAFFALATFTSFALITRERAFRPATARRTSVAFLAGLFAGLATLLDYQGLVVSAVLGVYALFVFYRPTRLLAFGVGAAIDVAVLMLFQWRAYGNPLTPGHKMLENEAYKAFHVRGVFGIEPPNWEHAKLLVTSPTFGLLGTSPYLWLALLAIPAALFFLRGPRTYRSAQRAAVVVAMVTMAVLLTVVSGAVVWRGGWTIGPRLVGAAPPFFACGAAFGLEQIARRFPALRTPLRAIAGGLACASVVQIGFVGLVYNTLPEDLLRPLPEFAIPLVRAGYSPHHLGAVVGWQGPRFFWFVLGCLFAAALVAALWPARDRFLGLAVRLVVGAAVFVFALRPAFSTPAPTEEFNRGDGGLQVRRGLVNAWEPPAGDALARARILAEQQGASNPCLFHRLAKIEAALKFEDDAKAHAAKVGTAVCH